MSVEKHLSKTKKFFGQGRYADAIYEYRCVLDIDPKNQEALSAMSSLTQSDDGSSPVPSGQGAKIKTNFLSNQADEASVPLSKNTPMLVMGLIVGIGAIFGLYQGVTYYMNLDRTLAMRYIDLQLLKPVQKDGFLYMSVQVENYNPEDIKDFTFKYEIKGDAGAIVSSGNVMVPGTVPAGDQRTFSDIKLGPITPNAKGMHGDIVDLKLGTKPSMTPQLANKFIEASAMKPQDALETFTDFVKQQPEFVPGYIRLGQSLLASNKNDLAIKVFEKGPVKLAPDDANAHYHLAVAYFYNRDAEAARKEFQQASKLAPDDQVISSALAQVEAEPGAKEDSSSGKGGESGEAAGGEAVENAMPKGSVKNASK